MTNQRPSQKERPNQPTGTSGRQDGSNTQENSDVRRDEPASPKRRVNHDDEDSPLGNRNTFR
jgi:hypothetical protein